MIEDHEAVVKAHVAIRQFEIVHRPAREFRLGEILQVVTPVAEAAPKRERQINLVEQFVARHQRIEHVPRIAKLGLGSGVWGLGVRDFALRTKRAKRQKRSRRNERIPRLRRIKPGAAEQHDSPPPGELFDERFGRLRGGDFLNERSHGGIQSVAPGGGKTQNAICPRGGGRPARRIHSGMDEATLPCRGCRNNQTQLRAARRTPSTSGGTPDATEPGPCASSARRSRAATSSRR